MRLHQITLLSLLAVSPAATQAPIKAQAEPPIIAEVRIEGNQRIEKDPILVHVTQEQDQPLDEDAVDWDIKSIYRMGFFDTVSSKLVNEGDETVLLYTVHERPLLVEVRIDDTTALAETDPRVAQLRSKGGSLSRVHAISRISY